MVVESTSSTVVTGVHRVDVVAIVNIVTGRKANFFRSR